MKTVKTQQQIMVATLAAAACLLPGMANAQSTYRSDRNGRPVPGNSDDSRQYGNYDRINGKLSVRTQRVRAGDSVALLYTVTNDSRTTQTFRFPTTRMFDMEAVRVDARGSYGGNGSGRGNGGNWGNGGPGRNRVVWRYSDDQLGGQALTDFTLRPGQSRSFVGRWQTDRNLPDGTYEVTSFLVPQRDNRVGSSTTRVIIENDRRGDDRWPDRNDRDDRPGRGNGNGGNWGDRDGVVEVRDLLRSSNSRYVDQRITVRGIYRSNGGGNDSWLLDDGRGQTLTVRGNLPKNGRTGDTVTVTGTLRQSRSGRLTLENN